MEEYVKSEGGAGAGVGQGRGSIFFNLHILCHFLNYFAIFEVFNWGSAGEYVKSGGGTGAGVGQGRGSIFLDL